MEYIGKIKKDTKYKYQYICSICGLASKDTTYHVIDFGGFNQILCNNCYNRFKEVLDKED